MISAAVSLESSGTLPAPSNELGLRLICGYSLLVSFTLSSFSSMHKSGASLLIGFLRLSCKEKVSKEAAEPEFGPRLPGPKWCMLAKL
jgi:hypothetical protein